VEAEGAVDAVVEGAAEVPRVPVADFPLQRERHVLQLLGPALGRARAVAKRQVLVLEAVRPRNKLEPALAVARRLKVRSPDSARGKAKERRMSLPGTAQHLVN